MIDEFAQSVDAGAHFSGAITGRGTRAAQPKRALERPAIDCERLLRVAGVFGGGFDRSARWLPGPAMETGHDGGNAARSGSGQIADFGCPHFAGRNSTAAGLAGYFDYQPGVRGIGVTQHCSGGGLHGKSRRTRQVKDGVSGSGSDPCPDVDSLVGLTALCFGVDVGGGAIWTGVGGGLFSQVLAQG